MKKLLAIIVLSLLLSGNVYAEIITLTKCYTIESNASKIVDGIKKNSDDWTDPTFKNWDEQTKHPDFREYENIPDYENILYSYDTVDKTITKTVIHTDAYLKHSAEEGYVTDKFVKISFKITDLGGNILTATTADLVMGNYVQEHKIDIDLKTKKIYVSKIIKYGGTSNTTLKSVITHVKIKNVEQCKMQR